MLRRFGFCLSTSIRWWPLVLGTRRCSALTNSAAARMTLTLSCVMNWTRLRLRLRPSSRLTPLLWTEIFWKPSKRHTTVAQVVFCCIPAYAPSNPASSVQSRASRTFKRRCGRRALSTLVYMSAFWKIELLRWSSRQFHRKRNPLWSSNILGLWLHEVCAHSLSLCLQRVSYKL